MGLNPWNGVGLNTQAEGTMGWFEQGTGVSRVLWGS